MSDQTETKTFNSVITIFMQFYGEEKYAEALAILEQEAPNFPEQAPLIYYNRACMYGVQNKLSEALKVLHEAADHGCWFNQDAMHKDTDFAALQGNPEFEHLVQLFQAEYEKRKSSTKPTRITVEPAADAPKPYPLLLGLHGNQSNAKATIDQWKPAAKAGWLVSALQSSQLGFTETALVWDNIDLSIQEVEKQRSELMAAYPVNDQRVVVGGFSMGGQIGALLGITQPFPVKGYIGVGPYLGEKLDEWQPKLAGLADCGFRAYLLVGDKDHGCYPGIVKLAEMFQAAKVPYVLKIYPDMAHVYPPDFEEMLLKALEFITA